MANMALNQSFKTATQNINEGNFVNQPPMTLQGVVNKVIIMFFLVLATAAPVWFLKDTLIASGVIFPLVLISSFIGLGLALWASFSKKVQKGAMLAYAAVEGLVIGGLSTIFEMQFPGIVMQAVTATMVTAGAIFLGWKTGIIKVTDRFMKYLMFGIIGYIIFALGNLGFALFTGANIYDTQFGWVIALIGCALAAFSLAADFQMITKAIDAQLPEENEWRGAFGLTVTLLWLYIEILRLLAIARR